MSCVAFDVGASAAALGAPPRSLLGGPSTSIADLAALAVDPGGVSAGANGEASGSSVAGELGRARSADGDVGSGGRLRRTNKAPRARRTAAAAAARTSGVSCLPVAPGAGLAPLSF